MTTFKWPLLLLMAFVMVSCSNRPTVNDKGQVEPVDSLIPFHGEWVREEYVNKLLETHSPREAQGSEFFLLIPDTIGKGGGSYVYHEGGASFIVEKYGPDYWLVYEGGEMEKVSVISGDRIKIGDYTYLSVNTDTGVAENVLFKGMYTFNDTTVELTANGNIIGLSRPLTYLVMTDYEGPGYGDFDIMDIRKDGDTAMCAFRFSEDTLFIYKTECLETDEYGTCLDVQRGRLEYTLIKKKQS